MSKELALLTQVKNKSNAMWDNIRTPKLLPQADVMLSALRLSDGTFIKYTITTNGVTKYASDKTTVLWTVLHTTVGASYDAIFNVYIDTVGGFVYAIACDSTSPFTCQFFKIAISTGTVTNIGATWTPTAGSSYSSAPYFDGTSLYIIALGAGSATIMRHTINVSTGVRVETALPATLASGISAIFISEDTFFEYTAASTTTPCTPLHLQIIGKDKYTFMMPFGYLPTVSSTLSNQNLLSSQTGFLIGSSLNQSLIYSQSSILDFISDIKSKILV